MPRICSGLKFRRMVDTICDMDFNGDITVQPRPDLYLYHELGPCLVHSNDESKNKIDSVLYLNNKFGYTCISGNKKKKLNRKG